MANEPLGASLYPCPFCKELTPNAVSDSRATKTGKRRRRNCLTCGVRITTLERHYDPAEARRAAKLEQALRTLARHLRLVGDADDGG